MSRISASLQRALPQGYRARAIWRKCIWAVNIRPWLGRRQSDSRIVHDSRSNNRGRFMGTIPVPSTYNQAGGRFVRSGNSSNLQWDDWEWKAIPQTGIYQWIDTGGMSIACGFQFRGSLPGGNRRLLTKRFGTANYYAGAALSFSHPTNKFEFSYCNGTTVESIYSATTPITGTTYVIVGRHWGNNITSRAELWVNGRLEAVNATPSTYPSYKKDPPIIFFGDTGSGDPTIDGAACMGAIWARRISLFEIQQLSANPYVLWGPPAMPMGLPFAGSGPIGCGCCPSWLNAWGDM